MERVRWSDTATRTDSSGRLRAVPAVYKFYAQGTGATDGFTTSGTPLTTALYGNITGGSPIGTTKTADTNGYLVVYSDAAVRFDVGIEYGGVAVLREDEGFEYDPGDLETYHVERNSLGYALVPNDASAYATNSTTLENLYAAVALAGGGNLEFSPGTTYYLDANTSLTHAVSTGVTINLIGGGGRSTVIRLIGTEGPWLDFGAGLTGTIGRSVMRDFLILQQSVPTSGAAIKLRAGVTMTLDNIEITGAGANIALETAVGVRIRHCQFVMRTSGGGTPTGILVNNSSVAGGLFIEDTGINLADGYIGVGIDFQNTALFDTVLVDDLSGITGAKYGVRKTLGAGTVQNVWFSGSIDGNGGGGNCLHLVPPTGAGCGTWMLNGAWLSGANQSGHIYLSTAGGGSVTSFLMNGGYLTDAILDSITIIGSTLVRIEGVTLGASGSGTAGIRVQSGLNVSLLNNTISMSSNAQASIYVSADAYPVVVDGNTSRGKDIIMLGARSASRKYGPNNVYAGGSILEVPTPASAVLGSPRQQLIGNLHGLFSDVRLLWIPDWSDTTAVITSEVNGGGILTWDATVASRMTRVGDADVPLQTFSGASQYGYVPDAAGLSFGDGSNDSAVTWWFFGTITDIGAFRTILSKYAATREWLIGVTALDRLQVILFDESAGALITRTSDAAISMGSPHLYTATYSGVGGATAGTGVALYQDASSVASTAAAPSGTYVAMENLTPRIEIGADTVGTTNFFFGSGGMVMVTAGVATTRQMYIVKSWLNAYAGLAL